MWLSWVKDRIFIILTVKKYINMKIIFKETKLVLQNNGNLYLSLTALIFLLAYVMQLISCYTLISSLLYRAATRFHVRFTLFII